jgi:transcriptional regulator with XRE-family HTH domain
MLNTFSGNVQALLADPIAKIAYMPDTFKARMKRLRLQAGYKSQQEAADAIGCERGTVGMWEAPSSPVDSVSGEYLMRVAAAYQVRPEYINTGAGSDGYPWAGEPAPESVSRSVRLDPETVRDVVQVLQDLYDKELHRDFVITEEPEVFVDLYQRTVERGSTDGTLFWLGTRVRKGAAQGADGEQSTQVDDRGHRKRNARPSKA